MSTSQESNPLKVLSSRSRYLKKVRAFFEEKGLLECDISALLSFPTIDSSIDPIEVSTFRSPMWLHTSPEYAMKKLIAKAPSDMYFLGKVYRDYEEGKYHSLEFTMLEWYRIEIGYENLIQETVELLSLFKPNQPLKRYSYVELFFQHVGINLDEECGRKLILKAKDSGLQSDTVTPQDAKDFLWTAQVEPLFKTPDHTLVVVDNFLESDAALAKCERIEGKIRAKRFEIYLNGHEVANGYDELCDGAILKKRFEEIKKRRGLSYAIDQELIAAVDDLPNTLCGVAVGFDRLVMIASQAASIHDVVL